MNKPELFSESNSATYCPEDDKLRLYVGRVLRDEYEALRREGWQSTAKQGCDFSAVWTQSREDTALSYAGIIDDEDMSPADRAADRAERFSGYLETNLDRAEGHADRYDDGPMAHGFQSKARAVRSADRHDRHAGRAVNAWDKAEYWQRRTSGVISNALHRSSPGVRMGRIKTIEAEIRKSEKSWEDYTRNIRNWETIAAIADPEKQTAMALAYTGRTNQWAEYRHPRPEGLSDYYKNNDASLYSLLSHESSPITGAEACAFFFSDHGGESADDCRELRHLKNRLAYEMQMLEAQGGRAALVEMEVGGFIGGHQIQKVNKSSATGRVVSVGILYPTRGQDRWGNTDPTAPEFRLEVVNIERLAESAYRAPTDEEREAFHTAKKAAKKAAPKSTAPSLINPTLEDAERLQAMMNEENEKDSWRKMNPGPQSEVVCMTQAQYQQISGGSYSSGETTEICAMGMLPLRSNMWTSKGEAHNKRIGPVLCKVRTRDAVSYGARRVIHLTDKPAKALPAAVWEAYAAEVPA